MIGFQEAVAAVDRHLAGEGRAITATLHRVGLAGVLETLAVSSPAAPRNDPGFNQLDHLAPLSAIAQGVAGDVALVVTFPDLETSGRPWVFTLTPGGAIFPGDLPVHSGLLDVAAGVLPRLSMSRLDPGRTLEVPAVGLLWVGPGQMSHVPPGAWRPDNGALIGPDTIWFQATPAVSISPDTTATAYAIR